MEQQSLKQKRKRRRKRRRTRHVAARGCIYICGDADTSEVGVANRKMLFVAAAHGNLKEVKSLVETCQCDPRHGTPEGVTALHCASYCGQLEVVKYLIVQAKCDPTAKDDDGECPLAYSAKCTLKNPVLKSPLNNFTAKAYDQNFHTAIYLMKNHILAENSTRVVGDKKSMHVLRLPLFTGFGISRSDQSELIELVASILGQDGVDKVVGHEVYTCFNIALKRHKFEFVKLLLSTYPTYIKEALASDPEQAAQMHALLHKEFDDKPPVFNCTIDRRPILDFLVELDMCKPNLTCFKEAIRMNSYDIVHRLILLADPNLLLQIALYILDQVKLTGSCGYCTYPDVSLVNLILVKSIPGSKSFIKDAQENNPLHLACDSVYCKEIICCINEANNSYQTLPNNDGKLPLHIACEIAHGAIQLVSSHPEINVNTTDRDGDTPLHIMCKLRSFKTNHSVLHCFEYLILTKKCNIHIKNNNGKLPLHVLLENLTHSCISQDIVLEQLLKLCSDDTSINVQDNNGNTPLHIACNNNVLKAVFYFASNSHCNKNLRNDKLYLPIHCAVSSCMSVEAVKVVNNDAWTTTQLQESRGITPLHLALRKRQKSTVKYFIRTMRRSSHINQPLKVYDNLEISLLCKSERDMDMLRFLADKQNVNQTNDKDNIPIHVACAHKNLSAVKFLTEDLNCDLSIKDSNGRLPLHIACFHSLDFVKLTSFRCDVNLCDNKGSTPLHIACQAGLLNVVQYLVKNCTCEASMTKRDHRNRLPADYACECSLEMLMLVSPSCHMLKDIAYYDTITTLDIASFYGALDIVQYLIEQNGYTLTALGGDHSALLYACGLPKLKRNVALAKKSVLVHDDVVKFLISKCGYDPLKVYFHHNSEFVSIFQYACYDNCLDLMKALTIHSVNLQDCEGNTPLHYACKYDCTEIVQFLVKSNCDQMVCNKNKELALHIACRVSVEIVRLLHIEYDTMNCQNDVGNTPLHIACAHSHNDITEYLLKQKLCRADILNRDGNLALHILLMADSAVTQPQILEMILNKYMKAAVVCNEDGLSPLHIAVIEEEINFFEILRKSGYVLLKKNILQFACLYRRPKIVHWLIQHGTRHAVKNSSGNLPQHLCFMGELTFCLETLVQLGSLDICSQNEDNDTIIHLACRKGKVEILRKILECSNICPAHAFSIQNNSKDTPLHLAVAECKSIELVELVATADNVNIQNSNGDTPLHIACRCKEYFWHNINIKIILFLICKLKSSVEVLNNDHDSPFHILLHKRSLPRDISIMHLTSEPLLGVKNKNGETILQLACVKHPEIFSHLIKSMKLSTNAIRTIVGSGATALHLACIAGDFDTVQLLVDCDPLAPIVDATLLQKSSCVSGDTALHIACRYGHLKIVRHLLTTKHKKAINALNSQHEQPIHTACHTQSEEMIKLFVGFTNNCDSQNALGNTLLHIACKARIFSWTSLEKKLPDGVLTVVSLLLYIFRCKASIQNVHKDLPLHIACQCKHVSLDLIKILSAGLSNDEISLQNVDGNTPLHLLLLSSNKRYYEEVLDQIKFFLMRTPMLAHICNTNGKQPIHLACRNHGLPIVKYLIKSSKTLELPSLLLHEACHNDDPEVLEYMTCEFSGRDINLADANGDTPLHLAIRMKRSKESIYNLIERTENINQKNFDGNTPLHEACSIVEPPYDRYNDRDPDYDDYDSYYDDPYYDDPYYYDPWYDGFNEYDFDRMCDKCKNKHMPFRLKEVGNDFRHCDKCTDTDSDTESDENNFLYALKGLLKVQAINLSLQNSSGETPLHCLCVESLDKGLRLVMNEKTFNANLQNQEGLTLLHIACRHDCHNAVKLLLSAAADPSIKDSLGRTPITLTNDPLIIKLLLEQGADPNPLYDMHWKFFHKFSSERPPPTPVKLFFLGNPSVGKTTLIKSLQNEFSESLISASDGHTAGVVPTKFSSSIYGAVTFYEFAGQPEYYASHDAIIHGTVKNLPPIVVIMVNLTNLESSILHQIHYWTNFIENRLTAVKNKAHLIVVGSHADVVSHGTDLSVMVNKLQNNIKSQLEHSSIVVKYVTSIDCTKSHSSEIKKLRQALKNSTSELREGGVMHFNSHCFLVFLYQKFQESNYITLGHVLQTIKMNSEQSEDNPFYLIPSDMQQIVKLCRDLDDRGHVYFIEHQSIVINSLVVLDKEPLLRNLLGSLFAPSDFPQHCPLSYSTGVIPLSRFERNCREALQIECPANMLLEFLSKMEYCREITDQIVVESIVEQEGYSNFERYYFFPNLVSLERPTDKWNAEHVPYKCGWLIQCSRVGEFFSPHFIQALLLRLVFSFTTQKEAYDSKDRETFYGERDTKQNHVMNMVIKRKCSVWKNGIYWQEPSGVKTIVDIIDQRTLVLLMNCQHGSEVPLLERRSMIISMVLNAKKEFCSKSKILEYFIHPEHIMHPMLNIDNSHLFAFPCIVQTMKKEGRYVINEYDQAIELNKLLYFEPYVELDADVIRYLWTQNTLQEQISDIISLLLLAKQLYRRYPIFCYLCSRSHSQRAEAMQQMQAHPTNDDSMVLTNKLLQIFEERFSGGIFQDLRSLFDRVSIFRGRQPPQAAGMHNPKSKRGKILCHPMNIQSGKVFTLMVREHASKWREIGSALGFSDGEMNNIQAKPLLMQSAPESWLRELLTMWGQWAPGDERGSNSSPTTEALRTALLQANLGQLAEMLK